MERLPDYGEWHLSNPLFGSNPPFAILQVDLRNNTGSVRYFQTTVALTKITRIAANRFGAMYQIGKDKGLFECEYQDDQTLTIKFLGSVSTECKARPFKLIGGERPVSEWSTGEKLGEAIRRSFPLLPADVRDELAAMLTPTALAIMGGAVVLWGVSQFFGVGEVADVILLIVGGLMLGVAAVDVAKHLAAFVTATMGAKSEADLDVAAQHFAAAVAKGGVQVVMTILLFKGPRAARQSLKKPVPRGQLPTELNAVPASKIPMSARMPSIWAEQGQQPHLSGLAQETAQVVRALLNKIRRTDMQQGTDCWGGSMELKTLAEAGEVAEGNATSAITKFDHTMWRIGNEYVDTRPGMWIKHFAKNPGIRAAVEEAVPTLASRLEQGAVLTIEEFLGFTGNRTGGLRSPMFNAKPLPH